MDRIAVIANDSNGLWLFRRDLIASLVSRGCKVFLITPFTGDEDNLRSLGAELIEADIDRRGTNPLADMKLLEEYKRLLKKGNEKYAFEILQKYDYKLSELVKSWLKRMN